MEGGNLQETETSDCTGLRLECVWGFWRPEVLKQNRGGRVET